MDETESAARLPQVRAMGRIAAALIFAVGCAWFERPPSALPEDAPPDQFAAARAMIHVREIAKEPHPPGSPANDLVRQYLIEALRGLGLSPEERPFDAGGEKLVNLLARIPGTASTGAVVLMAHYDSVSRAPGATDDASGVAAVLETIRALKPELPLRNDLIVLLTDGEETGLYGAKAFVREDPWFSSVKIVMNLEGRGNGGPSLMFETNRENGWVVRAYGETSPLPSATSACLAVYQSMPNDTDFSPFRDAGVTGLNFAHMEGITHYHTARDRPEALDVRSVQHHGAEVLALSREFGHRDLTNTDSPPVVYFSVLQRWLVVYPLAWEVPLALLGLAGAFISIGASIRRKHIGMLEFVGSIAQFTVVCGVFCAICQYFWSAYSVPILRSLYRGESDHSETYMYLLDRPALTLLLLTVLLTLVLYSLYRPRPRWISAHGLASGPLFLCAIAGCASAFRLPGFSYYFVIPLYFGLIVFWIRLMPPSRTTWALAAAAVAAPLAMHAAMMVQFLAALPTMTVPALLTAGLLFGLFTPFWFDTASKRA